MTPPDACAPSRALCQIRRGDDAIEMVPDPKFLTLDPTERARVLLALIEWAVLQLAVVDVRH